MMELMVKHLEYCEWNCQRSQVANLLLRIAVCAGVTGQMAAMGVLGAQVDKAAGLCPIKSSCCSVNA
jgi:hypothetical protein